MRQLPVTCPARALRRRRGRDDVEPARGRHRGDGSQQEPQRVGDVRAGIDAREAHAFDLLRRPEVTYAQLAEIESVRAAEWMSVPGADERLVEQVQMQLAVQAKYSGYIHRQAEQVERFQRLEGRPIPPHFDYAAIPQLRAEAKEKLTRVRPMNLGQASRISGINPADLAVLLIYLE